MREDYYDGDIEPKVFWVTQVPSFTRKRNDVIFNPLTSEMMSHLKPLIIITRVEKVKVNKIFIDGGVAINILPITLFKRFGKMIEDHIPHNIGVSDYSEKASRSQGVITLDLMVGSMRRPTFFIVV